MRILNVECESWMWMWILSAGYKFGLIFYSIFHPKRRIDQEFVSLIPQLSRLSKPSQYCNELAYFNQRSGNLFQANNHFYNNDIRLWLTIIPAEKSHLCFNHSFHFEFNLNLKRWFNDLICLRMYKNVSCMLIYCYFVIGTYIFIYNLCL